MTTYFGYQDSSIKTTDAARLEGAVACYVAKHGTPVTVIVHPQQMPNPMPLACAGMDVTTGDWLPLGRVCIEITERAA